MREDSDKRKFNEKKQLVKRFFDNTGKEYDKIVKIGTLGMDILWKKNMLNSIPKGKKIDSILDIACGTGIVTNKLAKKYPDAEILGIDVSEEYLSIARQKKNRKNIRFKKMRAEDMDSLNKSSFDLVITSYLPKYTDLNLLSKNTKYLLKSQGFAVYHDFTYPKSNLYRKFFEIYWKILSISLKNVDGWEEISKDLRDLIYEEKSWVKRLEDCLSNDFRDTEVSWQPFQIACIITANQPLSS